MNDFNILTRRAFLDRSFKISMGIALGTLTDIPFVMKRALAEGIGVPGLDGKVKKLLFIFLRGANDAINSVIPIKDSGYVDSTPGSGTFGVSTTRAGLVIPPDALTDYTMSGGCDYPADALYGYGNAIRLGNGFTALHPSLKYLAPVYNAGDLALIHRVGYAKQSRSHFDSQNYWENGVPNSNVVKDGIFYRTMLESGLANSQALTGVSIQSALPLLLRGSEAAMTNLSDPLRYELLGVPNTTAGKSKAIAALTAANNYPFASKKNRDLLELQYKNMNDTLSIFDGIVGFSDAENTFTDPDTGYYLFPATDAKNAGQVDVSGNSRTFFTQLKAAALVLNKTDAIIAGTEVGGFDTHNTQGAVTGTHANLQRRIGWAMYALRKYFMNHGDKATWDNTVVVTLSEFGRTSKQNNSGGTDHAEAGVMFIAGGPVKGYNKGNTSGVFNCQGSINSILNPIAWNTGLAGSMFQITNPGNYLKRTTDFRSVLGRIIRNHLGATQNQLNNIIPGYANSGEKLLSGGTSSLDNTQITGELDFI